MASEILVFTNQASAPPPRFGHPPPDLEMSTSAALHLRGSYERSHFLNPELPLPSTSSDCVSTSQLDRMTIQVNANSTRQVISHTPHQAASSLTPVDPFQHQVQADLEIQASNYHGQSLQAVPSQPQPEAPSTQPEGTFYQQPPAELPRPPRPRLRPQAVVKPEVTPLGSRHDPIVLDDTPFVKQECRLGAEPIIIDVKNEMNGQVPARVVKTEYCSCCMTPKQLTIFLRCHKQDSDGQGSKENPIVLDEEATISEASNKLAEIVPTTLEALSQPIPEITSPSSPPPESNASVLAPLRIPLTPMQCETPETLTQKDMTEEPLDHLSLVEVLKAIQGVPKVPEKTVVSQPEPSMDVDYLRELFAGAFDEPEPAPQFSRPKKACEVITVDSDDDGMLPDSEDEPYITDSDSDAAPQIHSSTSSEAQPSKGPEVAVADPIEPTPDTSEATQPSSQPQRVINMSVLATIMKKRFMNNPGVHPEIIHASVTADEAFDEVMQALKIDETQIIIKVRRRSEGELGNPVMTSIKRKVLIPEGPKKSAEKSIDEFLAQIRQPETETPAKDSEAESLEALRKAALSTHPKMHKEASKRLDPLKTIDEETKRFTDARGSTKPSEDSNRPLKRDHQVQNRKRSQESRDSRRRLRSTTSPRPRKLSRRHSRSRSRSPRKRKTRRSKNRPNKRSRARSSQASDHSRSQSRELSPASEARALALASLNQFRKSQSGSATPEASTPKPPPPEPESSDELILPPPPPPEIEGLIDNSTVVDMDVEEPESVHSIPSLGPRPNFMSLFLHQLPTNNISVSLNFPVSPKPLNEDEELQRKIRECTKRRLMTGTVDEDDLSPECSRPQADIGRSFPAKSRRTLFPVDGGDNSDSEHSYKSKAVGMRKVASESQVGERGRTEPAFLPPFARKRQMEQSAFDDFGFQAPPRKRFGNNVMRVINGKKIYSDSNTCYEYAEKGTCNRGPFCLFTHGGDEELGAKKICTRMLRGQCRGDRGCPFNHTVLPHQFPVCDFYLRFNCSSENCCFLHVKHSDDVPPCDDFNKGICTLGDMVHQILATSFFSPDLSLISSLSVPKLSSLLVQNHQNARRIRPTFDFFHRQRTCSKVYVVKTKNCRKRLD
ncbi:hypothetical protein L596_020002 [Steinernema carpocapsae]|uniref:C3H1-type domain-containing protein n=1 Tax=Steinernema carpocapsae TaxID=34508 RepID=A0A4U5MS82_STECR|nr:hypothetical protein L596_020002 [Steinernema carpocapsae]